MPRPISFLRLLCAAAVVELASGQGSWSPHNINVTEEPDFHSEAAAKQYVGQNCDSCARDEQGGALTNMGGESCNGRSMGWCDGKNCSGIPGLSCNCVCGFAGPDLNETSGELLNQDDMNQEFYCLECCPDAQHTPLVWKHAYANGYRGIGCPAAQYHVVSEAKGAKYSAAAVPTLVSAAAFATLAAGALT